MAFASWTACRPSQRCLHPRRLHPWSGMPFGGDCRLGGSPVCHCAVSLGIAGSTGRRRSTGAAASQSSAHNQLPASSTFLAMDQKLGFSTDTCWDYK